jgi:hypothetical protein
MSYLVRDNRSDEVVIAQPCELRMTARARYYETR